MSTAAIIGLVLGGLISAAVVAFWIWLVVVAVQFLRIGTQAFRRYLAMTAPVRPQPVPEPSPQGQATGLRAPPGYS